MKSISNMSLSALLSSVALAALLAYSTIVNPLYSLGLFFRSPEKSNQKQWMNAGSYKIANAPDFDTEWILKDSTVRFFDIYSKPIRSLYSQVHWQSHGTIPLPQDIVDHFENSTMAVVGYEVDQVRIDEYGKEVSVPITWAYNHHYMGFLLGRSPDENTELRMIQVPAGEAKPYGHAGASVWLPGFHNSSTLAEDDRSWSFFSEGNGGEMRKSYHAYPRGYAQLLHQPRSFSVTPMQIDTWNRRPGSKFESLPRDFFPSSSSDRVIQKAQYNPLLECPCTDRLPKKSGMTYKLTQGTVDDSLLLENVTECFDAAQRLLSSTNVTKRMESSDSRSTCEAILRSDASLQVVWKRKTTEMEDPPKNDLIVGSTPTGSIVNATFVLNTTNQLVEIILQGPYFEKEQEPWFAIGLGANTMCIRMEADECTTGGPYAILVMGDTVLERKLEYHGPGKILSPPQDSTYNLTIQSNQITVDDSTGKKRRVVRLLRPWTGPTRDYFSFQRTNRPLNVILAKGCSGQFGPHCGHESPDPISFSKVNEWQTIVRDGIKGSIGGKPFSKHCLDEPYGDLVRQHNPTCALETYRGGLSCCHHDHFLLDQNQTIPWTNQTLEYRLKFRFYYQDYLEDANQPSHLDLARFYWITEAGAGEYDIPECATPKDPDACIHILTSRWKVEDFGQTGDFPTEATGIELIYAGPHCHAPMCLSMELYNDDTGELLCKVEPLRGEGTSDKYDEAGFLAIPPCLWSHADASLRSPTYLSRNTTLLSIKRANSTFPHTGEMASWQMRGIFHMKHGHE